MKLNWLHDPVHEASQSSTDFWLVTAPLGTAFQFGVTTQSAAPPGAGGVPRGRRRRCAGDDAPAASLGHSHGTAIFSIANEHIISGFSSIDPSRIITSRWPPMGRPWNTPMGGKVLLCGAQW